MSTVLFFTVDEIEDTDIGVTFSPNHVPEHSQLWRKLDSFHYRAYQNKKSRVVDCLKEYLKCRSTKVQTDTKALFITYGKRFKAAAIDSVRRGVKDLFVETSILNECTPHTYRSTATSN